MVLGHSCELYSINRRLPNRKDVEEQALSQQADAEGRPPLALALTPPLQNRSQLDRVEPSQVQGIADAAVEEEPRAVVAAESQHEPLATVASPSQDGGIQQAASVLGNVLQSLTDRAEDKKQEAKEKKAEQRKEEKSMLRGSP